MKSCRQSARFKTGKPSLWRFRWFPRLAAFCLAAAGLLPRASGEPPAPASWRVVVAGALRPADAFTQPIRGARETDLAAAWAPAQKPVRFLRREEFAALGVDWAAFSAQSAPAASATLAKLEPEWVRGANEVIECAILKAKHPADNISPIVLAPDLLKIYRPVFGEKLLVAIPDRCTVFIFPRLASRYKSYGERILEIYRKSECPVSREVFELSTSGMRAIGVYGGP